MYLLFRLHHIMPMQYHQMGCGEKKIVKAFMQYEMEERNEEVKQLNNAK